MGMGHIRNLFKATPYIKTKREEWCHLLTAELPGCKEGKLGDLSNVAERCGGCP